MSRLKDKIIEDFYTDVAIWNDYKEKKILFIIDSPDKILENMKEKLNFKKFFTDFANHTRHNVKFIFITVQDYKIEFQNEYKL